MTAVDNAVQRKKWGEGPWKDEPDRAEWIDETTGYRCVAVRHSRMGHWCGYVAVPRSHPAFEQHYNDVSVDVHGGLTFSDDEPGGHEDETPDLWWFGFDCAHGFDLVPGMNDNLFDNIGRMYRDLKYVESECESLALQFMKMTLEEVIDG